MKPRAQAVDPGPPDRPQKGPQDRRGRRPAGQGDHVHLPDGEGDPRLSRSPEGGKGGRDAREEREGAGHVILPTAVVAGVHRLDHALWTTPHGGGLRSRPHPSAPVDNPAENPVDWLWATCGKVLVPTSNSHVHTTLSSPPCGWRPRTTATKGGVIHISTGTYYPLPIDISPWRHSPVRDARARTWAQGSLGPRCRPFPWREGSKEDRGSRARTLDCVHRHSPMP